MFGATPPSFTSRSGTYLWLTTARWLTPKAETLDRRPVMPDVSLVTGAATATGTRDVMLEHAVEYVKTRRTTPR